MKQMIKIYNHLFETTSQTTTVTWYNCSLSLIIQSTHYHKKLCSAVPYFWLTPSFIGKYLLGESLRGHK